MDAAHRRTGSLFLVVGVGLILAGAWGHGWATTESGHSLGLRDILAPDGATHGYTGFGRGNARLFAIAITSAYWTALVTAFFAVVALGNAFGPTPARRYLSAPRLCSWLAVSHAVAASGVVVAAVLLELTVGDGVALPAAGSALTILGCRALLSCTC